MSMNIFERAARCALCFQTKNGILKTEDLFGLPLETTGSKLSLDVMAQDIHKELEGLGQVSFVSTKPNPRRAELELKFEIVKHIIASKQADAAAAEARMKNSQMKDRLDEIIEKKKGAALENLSLEDLEKQRAALAN
jgi:hypothetical protein